jgi:2-iminobutanoate/2-iminopropanoate deaminase
MKGIFSALATLLLLSGTGFAQITPTPAIVTENFVFVTAQLPINTQTGKIMTGSMTDLTTLILNNIKTILKTKGVKMNQVIQTTIQLTDIRNYDEMSAAYAKFFNTSIPPTSSVVEVSNLLYNTSIQISCVASTSR